VVRLLAAAKVLLAGLLIAGSVYPHGPFEGVGGLHLTYADAIKDLLVSTSGGAVGAWWAVRRLTPLGSGRDH